MHGREWFSAFIILSLGLLLVRVPAIGGRPLAPIPDSPPLHWEAQYAVQHIRGTSRRSRPLRMSMARMRSTNSRY